MGVVRNESRLFPSVMMSRIIASDDSLHLPPLQFIIECMVVYADLAHEQLKQFVDGSQFFGCSPSWSSSFGSGSLPFSTSGMGKNSAASAITSLYALVI